MEMYTVDILRLCQYCMLAIWEGGEGSGRFDKFVSNSQMFRSKGMTLYLRKSHTIKLILASGSDLDNVLVQTVTTNYHRLGSLSNKHLFPTVSEVRKSKVNMLADLVLIKTHFLVCRWPSSSCFVTQRKQRGKSKLSSVSSQQGHKYHS